MYVCMCVMYVGMYVVSNVSFRLYCKWMRNPGRGCSSAQWAPRRVCGCECVWVGVCVGGCGCVRVCVWVCVGVYVFVCMYVYVCMSVCVYNVCMCVFMYVCVMYLCMYVCM